MRPTHLMALLLMMMAVPAHATPANESRSEVHGDWRMACLKQNQGERCSASQVQADPESGARTLAVEFQRGANGALQGVVALPFGLALSRGVLLALDEGKPREEVLSFSTCLPDGCIVPLRFDAAAVKGLRAAKMLKLRAIAAADGTQVQFEIPLNGLGKAVDRLP